MGTESEQLFERARQLWAEHDPEKSLPKDCVVPDLYVREASSELACGVAKRRRKWLWAFRLSLVAALFGGGAMAVDAYEGFPWQLRVDRGSSASLDYVSAGERERFARLRVFRFGEPADGHYFVNLRDRSCPCSLGDATILVLELRGEGLSAVRMYPRGDSNQRWRSPAIPITAEWQQHRIPIADFEYQTGGRTLW